MGRAAVAEQWYVPRKRHEFLPAQAVPVCCSRRSCILHIRLATGQRRFLTDRFKKPLKNPKANIQQLRTGPNSHSWVGKRCKTCSCCVISCRGKLCDIHQAERLVYVALQLLQVLRKHDRWAGFTSAPA